MAEDAAKEVAAGQRLMAEGEFKGALSRFHKAIRLDPGNPDAYFGKAEAAAALPQVVTEEIIASYQKAIELQKDSGERAMIYSQLGAFALRESKLDLAEQSYTKAAELDTENAPYYLSDLAIEYYMSVAKRMDEEGSNLELDAARKKSLAFFTKALDLSPKDAAKFLSV
jgi:tetratricopeptide (TPR) repeat protein